MVTQGDLQAVIMAAGKGSRMIELTKYQPKCLLTVGNLPMIWYPLNLLQKSGFAEAIIIVLENNKNEIQTAIDKLNLKIKVELVSISIKDDWGTADSLRYLEETNRLKSDVLVMSCDLIADVNLGPLLELYRKHNPALTALFSPIKAVPVTLPGPDTKNKQELDYVAINEATSRLVFIASASDFPTEIPLPRKLIKKSGRATLSTNLRDAHVYILSRVLCRYLVFNKNVGTIKGELLPSIVRKQTQELPNKLEQDKAASLIGLHIKTDLLEMSEESDLVLKTRSMSTYTDSRLEKVYRGESLRCYAHVAEGVTIRANSLVEYIRANKAVLEKWTELTGLSENRISPSASIQSTQLESSSCLIGEKVNVAEKTSIKGTVVASGSSIGTKTRISGSIVMSSASIGVGCNIQDCIICEGAVVPDGCSLNQCLVGSGFTIPSGGKHNHEFLTKEDSLMTLTL